MKYIIAISLIFIVFSIAISNAAKSATRRPTINTWQEMKVDDPKAIKVTNDGIEKYNSERKKQIELNQILSAQYLFGTRNHYKTMAAVNILNCSRETRHRCFEYLYTETVDMQSSESDDLYVHAEEEMRRQ